MRKYVLGVALATTALASPAFARDNSWYLEGDAGVAIPNNQDVSVGGQHLATISSQLGYDLGAIVGYDFGLLRLEGEASYRHVDNKALHTIEPATYTGARLTGTGTGALSFMANALLDVLGKDNGLQGFVGGGVGVADVKESIGVVDSGFPTVDSSSTGFAWQAIAGVRMPVSAHWDVGLKYRYFNAPGADHFVASDSTLGNARFSSHSVLATLTYNFGAAPKL